MAMTISNSKCCNHRGVTVGTWSSLNTYRWTAAAFAGKNAKTPIYILAMDDLKVSFLLGYNACTVSFHSYSAVGNMALFSVQEPALPRFFVHNT